MLIMANDNVLDIEISSDDLIAPALLCFLNINLTVNSLVFL